MTNAILAKDFDKCFGLGRYIIFSELQSNSKLSSGVLCLILSREEALVHILAHELRHLWQKNHPKKKDKVWGSRGQFSDSGADAYAIRRENGVTSIIT